MFFYVDDSLLLGQDKTTLKKVVDELERVFEVTAGEPNLYLGMEIKKEGEDGSILIHATRYIDRLRETFKVEDAKPISSPADPHVQLSTVDKKND